jgi:ketosteroid isomerase-like protein
VVESAADVVRNFYAGINGRDLASVEDLIADNCVYEDLIFPRPFVGRKVRFHSGLKYAQFLGATRFFYLGPRILSK